MRTRLLATAAMTAVAVAPVLAAGVDRPVLMAAAKAVGDVSTGGVGVFTPSAPDPVLARLLQSLPSDREPARTALKFTPTRGPVLPGASTVATHARSVDLRANLNGRRAPAVRPTLADTSEVATLAVKPISYKLGRSVGWTPFSQRSTSVADNRAITRAPVDRDSAGVEDARPSRFKSDFKLESAGAKAGPARGLGVDPSLDMEVGGRYRVSRSVDLKAGVRYRVNREPIAVDPQNSADSSAVYVGTAFKF